MLFAYLISYQNKKNETIYHIVEMPQYKVGDYTSMGWYVVDIQLLYDKRFYLEKEAYRIERHKYFQKNKSLVKKIIEKIKL